MKQLLQNLKNGNTEMIDIPCAQVAPGHLLIQTKCSLISSGTERMLAQFGKANLLTKARLQPDKVKATLDKIKTDGLMTTLAAVKHNLNQPISLGYANVGVVIAVGKDVTGWQVGDRVLSNGPHAEVVLVAKNLCAKIPDNVSDETAVFTVLAAIGLQGIRLAKPTLGEIFVVIGLGLIGLLTVQLLQAHGCRVIGMDYDRERLQLAKQFGAYTIDLSMCDDPCMSIQQYTQGMGVDGVLITSATQSNDPVHQAAQMCRKRGRIVLVGVSGLHLSRADFYEKELSFQVSCSYGPGRYDSDYENRGHDYPLGFVRWTAQRNFSAVLDLMAVNKLLISPLISHRFDFAAAAGAYDLLTNREPSLGILLHYPAQDLTVATKNSIELNPAECSQPLQPVIGVIGAGNYASRMLIPALHKTGAVLKTIAANHGLQSAYWGKKHGFRIATTDVMQLLNDTSINTVIIATRHDSHARLVCDALAAGKHVFVEKPLCLTATELETITQAVITHPQQKIMVGYNRRFAPHIIKIKELLTTVIAPKSFVMTVNAGAIPSTHWTQDPVIGGGRIIGEACHFIDLLRYLSASSITDFHVSCLSNVKDTATMTLHFADGSIGTIHYFANGHNRLAKERLEIFCAGKVLQLNNFRKLCGIGWLGFNSMHLWRQNKGHQACMQHFVAATMQGLASPIPWQEILEVATVSIAIKDQIYR